MTGKIVGPYRLAEELGRGGMGVVYRGERVDGEFEQTVAVKLIKRGMDTDAILRRFRRERQITAALNHPNIAYFYGGGSTDDGLPYFVMEYIAGRPLYRYCDDNRLTIRERLILFRQICHAVAAAHEIQVVHRDLKPSNILVKDDGKPKLLDFGIAKVLDPGFGTTEFEPTATQVRVMTPEYASPEQIAGEEIGIASDIYSLGIILFELLTGHRPYTIPRRSPDQAARIILEENPTSPSGSLTREDSLLPSDEGTDLRSVLSARKTTLEELRRTLSGDLDRVVLKALRKDATERYQSAVALADDITNYLNGDPVDAEFFLSGQTSSKGRLSDGLSIAVLPLKVLGSTPGNSSEEFLGVGLADALITRLSGVQRLVVRPTSSILAFRNTPAVEAGARLGVDYVLDGSVRAVDRRIRISVQLLNVNDNSTRWARAFDADEKDVLDLEDDLASQVASALLPQLSGEERRRLDRRGTSKPAAYEAYLRGRYFWSKFTAHDLAKAVSAFNQAIEIDPDYSLPYVGLADYWLWAAIFGEVPSKQGFSKAMEAVSRALEIDGSLGEAYAILSFATFFGAWNWDEAERLVQRALDLSPNSAFAHECRSNFLVAQGQFDEGINEIRLAEELDPQSPRAKLMTGWALYHARRYDEALEKYRIAISMQQDLPQGLLHLGNVLTELGETTEAVAVLRRAAEMWGESGLPRYMLAHARARDGNQAAVQKILNKLLVTAERKHVKAYFIAMTYVAAGDHDQAFEWFRRAVDEGNEWMIWFAVEPKLDPIRKDPRYAEILAQTRNPIANRGNSESDTSENERSIAVLPFHSLRSSAESGEHSDDYLSLGLADAVTMRLSNVRRFLVRPTSSVVGFSGRPVDPFEAGKRLGVDYVVDGIIRRIGGRIRVTAQLLNVPQHSTVWSATFADDFKDVLELEDSISEQVTKQLVPRLTGDEQRRLTKRGTNDPRAHEAYLQGRYFWNQFLPGSFEKAIGCFRRAIAEDPSYAPAYVGIADYFTWTCIYGMISPADCLPKVYEYASKALELDPLLAEAHSAMGLYYSNMQQWKKSEESYRRALELNPNYGLAHEWLSALLVGTLRFDEGAHEVHTAERLDPLSLRPKVLTAWTIYQTRDFATALAKARELEQLDPGFMQTHLQLANVLFELGEKEEALQHARSAVEIDRESALPFYVLTSALAANGLVSEARSVIEHWERQAGNRYVPPYFLGVASLAVGDVDSALTYLEAAATEKSPWVIWYLTEPKLDAIRDHSRFREILATSGLANGALASETT